VSICKSLIQKRVLDHVTPLIDCQGLGMTYPRVSRPVLNELDLKVAPGSFIAIVGRSGSGKSTLLKLLGAMERPTAGHLIVANQNLTVLDDLGQTLFRRRSLGFVFQHYNLLPTLNIYDNLRLPLELNRHAVGQRVQRMLETLNLSDAADRFPLELSGGEQQRVAIGRALIHQPHLVLADEPTGNLDSTTSTEVLALMREFVRTQGATIVMATHSFESARIADTCYALRDGKLFIER
jgi:putative ABC transport system ATP-binding protein